MRYLLAALAFLAPVTLYSQGYVRGTVTDSDSREPLPGVYVMLGKEKGTTTGVDGTFLISSNQHDITITFKFIGYSDVIKRVKLIPGDTVVADATMHTELLEIGQVVVSANRTEQKISELSVSMDVLKPEDFARSHITDTKELVNKTTGIEVIDGQASVRGGSGFSYGVGSRVLALIDGLPVLSADAGNVKWQFLPLENVSQIEIIKGASSVLYGSSALNGVINFRTADASSEPETKFYAEAGVFGKPANEAWKWWDTPRLFSTVSLSHLQKTGNSDIGGAAAFTSNSGYRKYNDETLGRLSLKFKHYSERTKGLTYGMNLSSGYTNKVDFVLWEDGTDGGLKQDTSSVARLHGSFLAIDPFIGFNGEKTDHDLRIRYQHTGNRFPVRNENNTDAMSFHGEYQAHHDLSGSISLISGIAWTWSRITANLFGNHTGFNLAAFAQGESTFGKLKLAAGLRLEHNALDGINDRLVPIFRAGANWQVAGFTWLRGSFGQGYRYPSVAEKHASTTLGAIRIYPNAEVKAEKGWSSEIGVKQGLRLGGFTGQADLAVFLTRNKELIEYVFGFYQDNEGEFGVGFRATNVEQSQILGYEAEFILRQSSGRIRTSFGGGYTFINPVEFDPAANNSNDRYLKYRKKHSAKLVAGAEYGKIQAGIDLYYKSRILGIDDVFVNPLTREQVLPGFYDYWTKNNTGYVVADLSAGYRINEKISISLSVKNITNTEYLGRPGDIQPHRNFSLRLSGIL